MKNHQKHRKRQIQRMGSDSSSDDGTGLPEENGEETGSTDESNGETTEKNTDSSDQTTTEGTEDA